LVRQNGDIASSRKIFRNKREFGLTETVARPYFPSAIHTTTGNSQAQLVRLAMPGCRREGAMLPPPVEED
jgi:hypothetical protein